MQIAEAFECHNKTVTRQTSSPRKSRRLSGKLHCLNFVFPAENETLSPVCIGYETSSSSSVSLSMLKVLNYIKRASLLCGLKQVFGTNLIPLRTKFDTQAKGMPAWPVINQLWFAERHFSANASSLRLGEVQLKFYERSLQALLFPAPRRRAFLQDSLHSPK